MKSFCTDEFWEGYNSLPAHLRTLADKSFQLWIEDQNHPGIAFKKLKNQVEPTWEARVGAGHRALCTKEGDDFVWFWIGTKSEAKKLY